MNFRRLLFSLSLACAVVTGLRAETRSGGPYQLHVDHVGSSGGRAAGSVYTQDSTLGAIGGTSDGMGTLSKAGYIGQLYEVVSLEITAAPATVDERSTRQLASTAVLDDSTLLANLAASTTWSVLSGPITGISSGGLASAGTVSENTPASVQGSWSGFSDTLNLTVLDIFDDRTPVSLAANLHTVFQGAPSVAVTLTRPSGEGPASVTLAASNGTNSAMPPFTGGVAGKDFQALNTVVQFANNELVKTQTVTLIPRTGKVPNIRFNVALSSPGPGATLGAITQAEIQILANDTTKPTISLKTPAAGTVSSVLPVLLTGTVGDAFGIERLEYSLNGSPPEDLMLGASTKATAIPFSTEIEPQEGQNTLTLTAYDLRGNSTTVIREFVFERRYVLTLLRNVPAGVAAEPDKAGTLALAAVPTKAASTLTKGPSPQTSHVVHGSQVTVTASAKTGHILSHWIGLPVGAQTLGNVVTFAMPEADVPGLTAVFVANPFPALVGTKKPVYQGLLEPDGMTPANNGTVGMVTGTLTPAKGTLSGKIWLDGKSTGFVAHLHGNGSVWFLVEKKLSTQFPFLGRSLEMSWSDDGLGMEVSGPAGTSDGVAKMPAYSKTQTVGAGLLNALGKQGYYTVALPAKEQSPAKDTDNYPQGTGYKTLTLLADGTFKLAGVLADGTKITAASYLVEGDEAAVFIQLPIPSTSAKDGSFSGTLVFDPDNDDSDVSALDMRWFRPAVVEGTTVATQLYTAGWPDGVVLDAVGALYDKNLDFQSVLAPGAPDVDGNAALIFKDGKLVSPPDLLVVPNINITLSKVAKIPATDKSFTLTLAQAKGAFKGTFTPNWTQANKALPKFQGVVLQKGANKGGYGYFVSNRLTDLDPESGSVALKELSGL